MWLPVTSWRPSLNVVIFTLFRSVSARSGNPQNSELLSKSNGGSVERVGGTA